MEIYAGVLHCSPIEARTKDPCPVVYEKKLTATVSSWSTLAMDIGFSKVAMLRSY